ncbi:MAG TPA: YhbY family RNA-binding protein [Eubacteriaceae bacterium]|jgi:RNA-binding protein|nr:YhbY family RNA-binding protein [Eubacteriaceae bacterium]
MLTSKERAYLKGLANNIPAIFQIGKEGLSSNLEKQLLEALEARELIKINVLNNSLLESKEVGQELANNIEAELVQVIGNKIIIYKESKENPKIKL